MDSPGTLEEMLAKGRRPYGLARCRVFERAGDFMETSPFGWRTHPATGERKFHGGVDGAVWTGAALGESWIVAPLPGVVAEVRDGIPGFDRDRPEGNFVELAHDGGVRTRYYHLKCGTVRVRPGDRVAPGDRLGYMGKTGLATGEHLHFELLVGGERTDPGPFLRGADFPVDGEGGLCHNGKRSGEIPSGSPPGTKTTDPTKASQMKKSSKLSAFTLIELLIVIAIIGILAAMLFPMIASALDSAQGTQVANNGKQIVMAITSANIDRAANMRGEVWPANDGGWKNSNEYFLRLMGVKDGKQGKAIISGISLSTFAGGGVDPAADFKEFEAEGNVWTMLAGIGACSDSRTPFLWTRNGVDITEEDFSDDQSTEADWAGKLKDGVKPFSTSLVVMVSKGAAMFEIKASDLSNKTFLGGTTNAVKSIKAVTPAGEYANGGGDGGLGSGD